LPFLCVFAVGANSLTVRAEDTPAQAAARLALEQKLNELNESPTPATHPVAEKPAVTPEPAVISPSQPALQPATMAPENAAPKVESAPPIADDKVVMTPVDKKAAKAKAKAEKAAAKAKAKQEAEKAAADLKAQKEADQKLAAEAKAAQAQAEARAKSEQAALAAAADKPAAAAPAKVSPPIVEAKPGASSTVMPPPAQTSDANYAGKDIGMKPMEAPALPISASKEDQLQALLAKYKADQITPEEYHNQRAALLAQP